MLSALRTYGAIAAKVRAMHGRMLSHEDWSRLCDIRDITGIVSFLRESPAYSQAVRQLPLGDINISALITALRSQVRLEYERLYYFASRSDKEYLVFLIYKSEYRMILGALRRINAGKKYSYPYALADFYRERGSVDFEALKHAFDIPSLLSAVKGSIFEEVIAGFPVNPETNLPDYASASILLENRYYSAVYSFLTKKYSGMGKKQLTAFIGLDADLLNIIHIIRLRQFFPASFSKVRELLIPVRYKLTSSQIDTLASAPTADAILAALQTTSWRKYFAGADVTDLERLYTRFMERFCVKQLLAATPTICIPQAYLTLKEIEAERLIRLIESVRYGVDPIKVL